MKNWRTTLFGSVTALLVAISLNPNAIYEWFPKESYGNLGWEIIRVANIFVFVFGVVTSYVMKDKDVTGGSKK